MLDFTCFRGGGPEDWRKIIADFRKEIIKHFELLVLEDGKIWIPTKQELLDNPKKVVAQLQKIDRARVNLTASVIELRRDGILPEESRIHLAELYNELGITDSVP